MSEDEIDLITKLLNIDPSKRLGNGPDDAAAIKSHPYFKDVEWDKYLKKEIIPPFKPKLRNELDLKYFDKAFTDENVNTKKQQVPRSRVQSDYIGFTFMGNSVKNELDSFDENGNGIGNEKDDIKEDENDD